MYVYNKAIPVQRAERRTRTSYRWLLLTEWGICQFWVFMDKRLIVKIRMGMLRFPMLVALEIAAKGEGQSDSSSHLTAGRAWRRHQGCTWKHRENGKVQILRNHRRSIRSLEVSDNYDLSFRKTVERRPRTFDVRHKIRIRFVGLSKGRGCALAW